MPPRDPVNNPTLKKEPTAVAKTFAFPIRPELPPRSKEPFTITIYQLRHHDCRWPSGEQRPPFTYCGRHAPSGRYCAEHSQRAHSTPRPRPL
jgi:hypothetical protein